MAKNNTSKNSEEQKQTHTFVTKTNLWLPKRDGVGGVGIRIGICKMVYGMDGQRGPAA